MRFFWLALLLGCAGTVQKSKERPFRTLDVTSNEVIVAAFAEGVGAPEGLFQNAEQQAREDFSHFIAAATQHLDIQLQAADQESLKSAENAAVIDAASRVSMGKAEHTQRKVEREEGTPSTHVVVRYRISRKELEAAFAKGISTRKSKEAIVGATFDALRPSSEEPSPRAETKR